MDNLFKRGVLLDNANLTCVFCSTCFEGPQHLFISCTFAQCIWYKVYGWLGVSVVQPNNLVERFLQHRGLFGGKE